MKVLYSDLLIGIMKKNSDAFDWFEASKNSREDLATTALNAQELLYGSLLTINPSEGYRLTAEFIKSLSILDLDLESAELSSRLRSELKKKGQSIGIMDEMIAGICLRNDASIVTRNTKHFSRVGGLDVEKW